MERLKTTTNVLVQHAGGPARGPEKVEGLPGGLDYARALRCCPLYRQEIHNLVPAISIAFTLNKLGFLGQGVAPISPWAPSLQLFDANVACFKKLLGLKMTRETRHSVVDYVLFVCVQLIACRQQLDFILGFYSAGELSCDCFHHMYEPMHTKNVLPLVYAFMGCYGEELADAATRVVYQNMEQFIDELHVFYNRLMDPAHRAAVHEMIGVWVPEFETRHCPLVQLSREVHLTFNHQLRHHWQQQVDTIKAVYQQKRDQLKANFISHLTNLNNSTHPMAPTFADQLRRQTEKDLAEIDRDEAHDRRRATTLQHRPNPFGPPPANPLAHPLYGDPPPLPMWAGGPVWLGGPAAQGDDMVVDEEPGKVKIPGAFGKGRLCDPEPPEAAQHEAAFSWVVSQLKAGAAAQVDASLLADMPVYAINSIHDHLAMCHREYLDEGIKHLFPELHQVIHPKHLRDLRDHIEKVVREEEQQRGQPLRSGVIRKINALVVEMIKA